MSARWAADAPQTADWVEARIVLIRHGESTWNAEDRVQGQQGSGLSPLGAAQAAAACRHLARTYPDPALVVSSDLERVVQTAQAYLTSTGTHADVDKRFREIDNGAWCGLTTAEVAERFPDEIAAIRAGEDIPRGGGETFRELRARVSDALRDVATRATARVSAEGRATAVVFTHGGPVRVAVAHVLGLPDGGHRLLEPPANCSATVVDVVLDGSGEALSSRLIEYNATPWRDADADGRAMSSAQDAVGEAR